MLDNTNNIRVLALDLRSGRFGFAVLEGPSELLEWGARRWYPMSIEDGAVFIRRRIAPLSKLYAPSVIIVKAASRQGDGVNSKHEHLLKTLMDEAQRQSVELALVGRKEIRSAFAPCGRATKHAIAARIARHFPELTWKLPPARKTWTIEAHSMTIFDAVSLGLTYLARFGDIFPNDLNEPQARTPG